MKAVFILAAKQISAQLPLSEDWMDAPLSYDAPLVRAIDPDYKQHLEAALIRRSRKLLKRALLSSRHAMQASGIPQPDAIITGTGLGCIENTELFLDSLVREGEALLKPTWFMQSTHNSISSFIAMDARCQGYNSTYTHQGISFESALLDAFMQLEQGELNTALVGAHDEMTPAYFTLLRRTGYLGHTADGFAGEAALSLALSCEKQASALCRVEGLTLAYRPKSLSALYNALLERTHCRPEDIDAVMIGLNGQPANDQVYAEACPALFPGKPLLRYKHLFGESYAASGMGVYTAAVCLAQGRIPGHLFVRPDEAERQGVRRLLCYNQFDNKNHSLILLSACGE